MGELEHYYKVKETGKTYGGSSLGVRVNKSNHEDTQVKSQDYSDT